MGKRRGKSEAGYGFFSLIVSPAYWWCLAIAFLVKLGIIAINYLKPLDLTDPLATDSRIGIVQIFAQCFAGLVIAAGVYFAAKRAFALERQVQVTQEGQVTERYSRAVEQLSDDKLHTRLGGIYALEHLAKDSPKDYHQTVFEVLTAFIRTTRPLLEPQEAETEAPADTGDQQAENEQKAAPPPFPEDVQAALTVIGRRNADYEVKYTSDYQPILHRTNLSGASFKEGDFTGVNFGGSDLSGADLFYTDLYGTVLCWTIMHGADLTWANLSAIDLDRNQLRKANIYETNLHGADLRNAVLEGTDLRGVDLSEVAHGITNKQLEVAITDKETIWPEYLERPTGDPPPDDEPDPTTEHDVPPC